MSLKDRLKLGGTGAFPEGRSQPNDEGELKMAIGVTDGGLVHIEFGKPIAWLSMSPGQAKEMAALLLRHAASIPMAAN